MSAKEKTFALVTGASKGLGRNIAYELANKGFNLLLVSLPGEDLNEMANEPIFKNVEVHCIETDLTDKNQLLKLADYVNENYKLCMLVNNAGVGCSKSMLEAETVLIDTIIQLNITATSILTHRLLPNLLNHPGKSYILNVSSMASFSPMAFKTVYPASKRFVRDFSRGLRYELKGTNVSVSVTYPGPMSTNQDIRDRAKKFGPFSKILVITPEQSARVTVNYMLRKRQSIIPGFINRVNWLLMCLVPDALKIPIISGQFRKISKLA